MRVRMLTTAADPEGVRLTGSVYELDEAQALEFIRGGYAVAVDDVSRAPTPAAAAVTPTPTAESEKPKAKAIGDMNKAELQTLATELGLDTGGTNKELIERIKAAQAAPGTDNDESTAGGDPASGTNDEGGDTGAQDGHPAE